LEPRRTLLDAIRDGCGLTGTHMGCEHGVCGACTVLVDGDPVRACLMFAVQAEGSAIRTVEGLAEGDQLNDVQQAFIAHHGVQCGFCTPGFLMLATGILEREPDIGEDELLARVAALNESDDADAILVQLPLPGHIDEGRVIRAIAPAKDVDGLHPLNAGELYLGRPAIVPATPRGVMALLAEHEVALEGARAVVIGRSAIVGKPMAHLLLQANATVTVCHSRTRELADHTREADVLVVAVGSPAVVRADMVKPGAVVVDVGMNRTDAGLVGDVDPAAFEVASAMTPVPGGVGPLTIACLLENAVRCARYRPGDLAYPG